MIHIEPIKKGFEIYANTREYSSLTQGYFNKKKKQHYDLRDSLTGAQVEECLKYLATKGHSKLHNNLNDAVAKIEEDHYAEYGAPEGRNPFTISILHDMMNEEIDPKERADKNWYKIIWGVYTNTIEQMFEEAERDNNQRNNLRDMLRKQ